MPHKHRRDKAKSDPSYWDLPPTKTAQPLTVAKSPKPTPSSKSSHPKPPPRKADKDDTPRAFARLLQPYRPPRSGHDDGLRPSKKRKLNPSTTTSSAIPATPSTQTPHPSESLKILPHEPLSHFAARVDTALPFSTLAKSRSSVDDPALKGIDKGRKTKTEKKMQRMQREWREADRRRREKVVERGEEGEGVVDERGVEEMGVEIEGIGGAQESGKGNKKGKRKRGGQEQGEGDLWREVELKRGKEGMGPLVGLHDVVSAPPRFGKGRMGDKGGSVGVRDGGLKRQVEMGEARRSVVEGYREMMKKKMGGGCVS